MHAGRNRQNLAKCSRGPRKLPGLQPAMAKLQNQRRGSRRLARTRPEMVRSQNQSRGSRELAGIRSAMIRPLTRLGNNQPGRCPPLVRCGLAVAIALMPTLVAGRARAAGHPATAPTPAVFSTVEGSRIIVKRTQELDSSDKSNTMLRVCQRLTQAGPVMFFEQAVPDKGKANGVKICVAQGITIGKDTVAQLGLRTPALGDGKVDFGKTGFGLMISNKGFGAEFDRMVGKDASRFLVKAPVGKGSVDLSYMDPGYFSTQGAVIANL